MNNKFIKSFINILTALIVIWTLTPFYRRNIPIFLIMMIVFIWIILSFFLISYEKIKVYKYYIYLSLWIILIIGYRIIGYSNAAWGNYFNQILFYIYIWIGDYYINVMGPNYCRKILKFTIIISAANIISNVYLLILYPNASTEINFSSIYYNTNVGGTELSIFSLILFCILIVYDKTRITMSAKNCIHLVQAITLIYIFQASRATVIIFLFIAVIILIYQKLTYNKNVKEKMIIISVICILITLIITNGESIFNFIANNISNERLAIRIRAIANIFSGKITEDSMSLTGRVDLYLLSISTFFDSIKNFILGVGYHTSTDNSLAWIYSTGVGAHSQFLDLAARYGVIGVIFTYGLFKNYISKLKEYNSKNQHYKDNIVWIIFISYSFINNTFAPSIGVLIFFVYPIYLARRSFLERSSCS